MINIRYINIFDISKIKKLTSYLENGDSKNSLIHPLSFINFILPPKYKFLEDTYVATQNGKIMGMISVHPRKNNSLKWRITNLFLNDDYIETGKQLIDFVVTKYGNQGVETFEVEIDSENTLIINLFSKTCGFRYCMDYQFYKLKTCYYKGQNILTENNIIFRPFKNQDKNAVASLYNQNISTYYKFPLSKIPEEFKDSFFKGLNSTESLKFILEDKFSKQIRGFINITSKDRKLFITEIILLQSYENYFENMIIFAISQISRKTNNFSLYFKNCKFHSNSEIFEKILYEIDNELIKINAIFVKDFFRQIKNDEVTKSSSTIYNEINGKTAYKI